MIKWKTIGQLDVAKNNPVLTSTADVDNYSFIEDDGDLYVIMNEFSGDDAYKKNVTIPKGEYLNGFLVKAWDGQILIVDEEHISYGLSESYESITPGTTLFAKKASSNKLEIIDAAPDSGVYFKAVKKVHLTGNAVELKVMVVDATE